MTSHSLPRLRNSGKDAIPQNLQLAAELKSAPSSSSFGDIKPAKEVHADPSFLPVSSVVRNLYFEIPLSATSMILGTSVESENKSASQDVVHLLPYRAMPAPDFASRGAAGRFPTPSPPRPRSKALRSDTPGRPRSLLGGAIIVAEKVTAFRSTLFGRTVGALPRKL